MSPRLRPINLSTLLCTLLGASTAFAQSQWKEIPVGYNMPKSVMAVASLSTMAVAAPPPAKAATKKYYGQERDPYHKWEVEFHGGGFWNTGGEGGSAAALPAGTPFLGGNPPVGPASLAVSSYFFGAGANFFNQFAQGGAFANTITPLDPVLASQLGKRNSGPSMGVRIGRDVTPRFGLEFSADWNNSPVSISDNRLLAVENTRASFANSFTELTGLIGGQPALGISSVRRSAGSQLFWTGVVNVNLRTTGKTIPYLSFGGGGVSNLGPAPHAALLGFYAFDFAGAPHAETDLVNVQTSGPRTQGVGVLGIGMKYFATPRWGIRFDLRDHVVSNSINTVLFAKPSVAALLPGQELVFLSSGPNLIFSNNPSSGPSTLSGPAIQGIRTFKGDGITNQLNFSAGVLYRF